MAESGSVVDGLIDTARYPFGDLEACREVVVSARSELADRGCCVLPGFVRSGFREILRQECAALAPLAHPVTEMVNVYKSDPDPGLPSDHPARLVMRRGNALVARDRIPRGTVIQRLYAHGPFQRFLAECFGLPALYELGDPLAGLCLNVIPPRNAHPWHFDINEFTVSMITQLPDHGGEFEYCPNIRSARNENRDAVRAVLTGEDKSRVRRLALNVGDLQLFLGRYSLHQVREVRGERTRLSAIFAYSGQPGVVGGRERTQRLFGRVQPQHRAGAKDASVDGLLA